MKSVELHFGNDWFTQSTPGVSFYTTSLQFPVLPPQIWAEWIMGYILSMKWNRSFRSNVVIPFRSSSLDGVTILSSRISYTSDHYKPPPSSSSPPPPPHPLPSSSPPTPLLK